jgi:hypothetical protein
LSKGLFKKKDTVEQTLQALESKVDTRLVFMLSYMEKYPNPNYPQTFAKALYSFKGSQSGIKYGAKTEDEKAIWGKAAEYACLYLSALGLVKQVGSEYTISDFGRAFILSPKIRGLHEDAFKQTPPRA